MKAWQLPGKNQALALVDAPTPVAERGEVVVDVRAAGLCHSDVGYLENDAFVLPHVPFILGHEIAGVISSVGDGVNDWFVGDRVAVAPVGRPPGTERNGGFAEKVAVQANSLIRIPNGLSFAHAAIAMDAGMTSYGAVMRAGAACAGMKVGIIGFGGLGQFAVQIASLAGSEVYVAEIKEQLWARAMEFGAMGVAASIRDFAANNLDVVVDFAGFGTTTNDAIAATRERGRVVLVGLGVTEVEVSTWDLCLRRITLVGFLGGSVADAQKVCELLADGHLQPRIAIIGFDDIPAALAQLTRGDQTGRLVATFGD